jgi:hypothetical protein
MLVSKAQSTIRRNNALAAAALVGFVGGVWVWTTRRMKNTDVLSEISEDLDEVRKLKKDLSAKAAAK